MEQCTFPKCVRLRWGSSTMCHSHSGGHQQWISNIRSSSGTFVKDAQEPMSQKARAKTKWTDPNGAGSKSVQTARTRNVNAFLQQPSPVQSEMQRLPGQFLRSPLELNAPMLPGVYGAQLQSLFARQQFMQHKAAAGRLPQAAPAAAAPAATALYFGLPAYRLSGMVPDQAMPMASQPVGMLQSGNVGTVRGVGSHGNVSGFRLSHNRRDGGEGEPCQNPSSAGQKASSWHTPYSATSVPDSIHDLLGKHPRPAVNSETMEDSLKKVNPSDCLRQADGCTLDLSHGLELSLPQPQDALTRELCAGQQQQQQNHDKGNVDSLPGRNQASKVDDVVDDDVLFIGEDCREKPKVGVNMGKHVLVSPVSDKHPSVLLSGEGSVEISDSDDDDFIVLDLSMESPPVEDNAKHQEGHMDKENGRSLDEQNRQGERRSSVQLIEGSGLSTGQNCGTSEQSSAETEGPSEIQVLETVSLSEQPSTDLQEWDARAKTYRQLSTESYYCCGCVKGTCGFRTVFPTQLELHLQECHPYDVIYLCVHCGSQEMGIDSLMSHLEQHLTLQEFSLHCSNMSCTYTSSSQREILCHIGKCHPSQNGHICGKCSHRFDSLVEFTSHIKTNCLSLVRCQYCSAKDVDRQAILMHMASSHPDQSHTVTVQKILICQERRRNLWSTADYNTEELDGLEGEIKEGKSLAGQSVHLVSQTDLSKSSHLSAGKELAVAEIAVDILDRGGRRNSVQEQMKETENAEHAHTTGEEVEMEADIGSWIDTTCYDTEEGMVRCCICDYESKFVENHARHVHSSHNSLFKGFVCERCNLLSIDRDTQTEHRCGGSHRLRSRSRVMYSEDDSALWNGEEHMLSDTNSVPSVTQSTASKMEDRMKRRSKTKRARPWESSSAQLEERSQGVDPVDNLPLSKKAKLFEKETRCVPQGETDTSHTHRGELVCKTKTPKSTIVGCASGAESGRNHGVQLLCKLCGLKGTSRSSMQQHVYTLHPHDVACPLCSEKMYSDRQLHTHLMDLHANQSSIFEEVKSHNFISLISGGNRNAAVKDEGNGNSASTSSFTASETPHLPPPSDPSNAVPIIPDANASFNIILKGEVPFLSNCADMSSSVPLMSKEQYEVLAALEVNDCMEFRCKHCTSNFKWRYKFYEHLCYHYHYRCFQCAHCPFLAFSGSSVVNHSRRTHDQKPHVLHLPKPNFERRIERVISEAYIAVTEPYTTQRLMAYERARLRKMSKRESVEQKKEENKIKISTETRKKVPANKKKKTTKKWRNVVTNVASQSEADGDGKTEWLRCPYCRGAKKQRPAIEIEIRYHIHYKPFCCPYCQFTSGSEQCSLRHIAKAHPGNNITVNYERIEKREVKFTDLLSRAIKLSKLEGKREVTTKVKRKYRKKKVSESGTAAARREVGGGTREETKKEADNLQSASTTKDMGCAHYSFIRC